MRKKKYEKKNLNLTDSQGFFALRRRDDIDKSFNEFIELGTKPGPVDRIGIGFGVNGAVWGEVDGEEGLDGENDFKDMLRRWWWRDECEEERKVVDVGSGREKLGS